MLVSYTTVLKLVSELSGTSANRLPLALISPDAVMWVVVISPSTVNNELLTVPVPIATLSSPASTKNAWVSLSLSTLKSKFALPPSFNITPCAVFISSCEKVSFVPTPANILIWPVPNAKRVEGEEPILCISVVIILLALTALALILPTTSNFSLGEVVPIPRFPLPNK